MSGSSTHPSPLASPKTPSSIPSESRNGKRPRIDANDFDWLGDPDLHADFARPRNTRCPEMYDGLDQNWDVVNKDYFATWGEPDYDGEGWGQWDDDGELEDGYPRGRMAWWEIEQQVQESDNGSNGPKNRKKRTWGFHECARGGWAEEDENMTGVEDEIENEGLIETEGWVVDCGGEPRVWGDTGLDKERGTVRWGRVEEPDEKLEMAEDLGLALDRCNDKVHCMMKHAARKLSEADMWPEYINFWWIAEAEDEATYKIEEGWTTFLDGWNSCLQEMIQDCKHAIRQ